NCRFGISALVLFLVPPLHACATEPTVDGRISPTQCLVIKPAGEHIRAAVHIDEIEQRVVTGQWKPPRAGDAVAFVDGAKKTWEPLGVGPDGSFSHAS